MEPVRIKVYGLLPLTRRRYLTMQAVGLVLLLALFVVWLGFAGVPADHPLRRIPVAAWLLDRLPLILVIVLLWEAVETAYVLRRFARAEAEQRTRPPASPPNP